MRNTFWTMLIVFGLLQNSGSCGKNTMQNSNDSNRPTAPKNQKKVGYDRLPENIKLATEVRRPIKNEKGETVSFEITTVEKTLNELKAGYQNNVLVDGKGREIRFYEPLCRGVSRGTEEDEQDQKEKADELAELEKKYTVLVLHCDPRKVS